MARPSSSRAHEAEVFAARGGGGVAGGERAVEQGQGGVEVGGRHRGQRGGHQRLDVDVGGVELDAGGAGEDEQLAADVGAREIVARIGLGVASGAGRADQARERLAPVVVIAQPGHRAREHAGDGMDAVTACH